MSIKITVALTDKSGRTVAADSIIVPKITFPDPIRNFDDEDVYEGCTRQVAYDFIHYPSQDALRTKPSDNGSDLRILGGVQEFDSGWVRTVTNDEYASLLANGTLAEVWLKTHLETIIGSGNCVVLNPY